MFWYKYRTLLELGLQKQTYKLSNNRNRKYRLDDFFYKPCNLASFPAFLQSKPILSRYGNIYLWEPICHVAHACAT